MRLARAAAAAALSVGVAVVGAAVAAMPSAESRGVATNRGTTVGLAPLARGWVHDYELSGRHSMPTWVEEVALTRRGDRFVLTGGAPAGYRQSRSEMRVDRAGRAVWVSGGDGVPSGFLTAATMIGAARAGRFGDRRATVLSYGPEAIVCVDAKMLGVSDPLLDPCAEISTGAVVAFRHRRTGGFDGPSLDQHSIRIARNTPDTQGR